MATLSPYINFAGKTQEALEFYKSIFGGDTEIMLAKDGPMASQTPDDKQNDVFHSFYRTDHFTLMASDMMSDEADRQVGNVIALAFMNDSAEQLKEWFDKLADGGTVVWPIRESEWGDTYGQVTDKFGITWMLDYHTEES